MPIVRLFIFCLLSIPCSLLAGDDNVSREAFLSSAFGAATPQAGIHWLTAEDKAVAESILQHKAGFMRVRYWYHGARSAWILDEIGKEKPITIGIVVDNGKVADVHILAFRESRGGEVQFPSFRRQFSGAALSETFNLDVPVDGITGATLSVYAVKRTVRLALYLDGRVERPSSP